MLSSRIVRCLLPAAVLTVAACTVVRALPASEKVEGGGVTATAPDKGNDGYGKPTEGIRLKLELPDDVIVAGETATVTLTVKNVSKKAITFSVHYPQFDNTLLVKDPAGKMIKVHSDLAVFFSTGIFDLAPGKTFVQKFNTRNRYSFEKPGTYVITATRSIWKLNGKARATVVSNTVKLRVIEDKGQEGAP